jgi:LEA14-like dessication related protein
MRTPRVRLIRFVGLAIALAALPGCKFLMNLFGSVFQRPTLEFRGAQLTDLALSGLTLNLNYDLVNKNPVGLSLAEVDYALFVEDHQVVAGKPPQGLQIPANGTGQLTFPANVKFQDIAPVIETFLTKDRARYRAEGHIGVSTPIGVIPFPIKYESDFEVPKLPAVQFGSPRVTNLSYNGATIEFPLSVTNRNSFDLPINGVGGAINIAGANVGTINTGDLGALAGRATKQVTLPLSISLSQVAAAANTIKNGGNANVGFNGSVKSGPVSIPLNFTQNVTFKR